MRKVTLQGFKGGGSATLTDVYGGDTPKKNKWYYAELVRVVLKENSSGDSMLSTLVRLKSPWGDKDWRGEFDGAPVWGNFNLTKQGEAWTNTFLMFAGDVPEGKLAAWWKSPVLTVDEDDRGNDLVVSIGGKKLKLPKLCKVYLRGDNYDGEDGVKIDRFGPEDSEDSAPSSGKFDEDDDEPEDGDEDDEADEEDEDEDEDEDDEDEEGDDGDEEDEIPPPPVKSKSKKSASAKKAKEKATPAPKKGKKQKKGEDPF